MLKKLKRVIALMMVVILSSTSLISCKDEAKEQSKEVVSEVKAERITRGEWIASLAEAYGMVQYDNTTPYYSDVAADNPIFAYVQSCYEWNVLSTETKEFNPDEEATLGFVLSTSVLAAELDYEACATSDDVNESIINCANKYGLTNVKYSDKDKLTAPAEKYGAESILQASLVSYMASAPEDIVNIVYRDTVVDATQEETAIEQITVVGTNNNVPAKEAEAVEVGSIILMPGNEENPFGYSLKVVSKTLNSDGTYTIVTEEPQIYEVFESIEMDTEVAATSDMFEPAEGITVIENEEADNVEFAKYITDVKPLNGDLSDTSSEIEMLKSHEYESKKSKSITVQVSVDDEGKIDAETEIDIFGKSMTVSVPDLDALENFDKAVAAIGDVAEDLCEENDYDFVNDFVTGEIDEDEFEKKLEESKEKVEKKVDDGDNIEEDEGWEITGSVSLEASVEVKAKIYFTFFDTIPSELEEFSVKVSNTYEEKLEVKGTYESSIELGKLKIPLANGFGITLKTELFLDYNGSVSIKYTVDSSMKISYDGNKVKKTNTKSTSNSIEAATELEGGLKYSGTLTFWGIGLAEVGVKVSGKLTTSAELKRSFEYGIEEEEGQKYFIIRDALDFSTSGTYYAPLLSFWLGGDDTLLGWIGLEFEYEALSEDNAPRLKLWEYDSSEEGDSIIFFEDKVPIPEEETTTEETTEVETTEVETSEEETTTEEPAGTGIMSLSEFVVTLDVGETVTLTATLPEGYTAADLVWSVDGGAATVSNGVVKAVSSGNVTVKAVTSDGKYEGVCTVVVN